MDFLERRGLFRWAAYALFLSGMWAAAQGWWWLCLAVLGRWAWEAGVAFRRRRSERPFGPASPPEDVGTIAGRPVEDHHRELLHFRRRDIGLEMGDLLRVATRVGGPELAAGL